jgi:hypothetical protein
MISLNALAPEAPAKLPTREKMEMSVWGIELMNLRL